MRVYIFISSSKIARFGLGGRSAGVNMVRRRIESGREKAGEDVSLEELGCLEKTRKRI